MAKVYIEKKNGKDYARLWITINGKRLKKGLGYKLSAKAIRKLETIATELEGYKIVNEKPDPKLVMEVDKLSNALVVWFVSIGLISTPIPRLEEFLQGYIDGRENLTAQTIYKLKNSAKFAVDFFVNPKISEITRGQVSNYIEFRRGLGRAEQTIKTEVKHIKHAFTHAINLKYIAENPFAGHKFERTTVREPTEVPASVLEAVINSAPSDDWLALIAICRWTGCRLSEAFRAKWTHIDWNKDRMLLISKKTEKKGKAERYTVIDPQLKSILSGIWETSSNKSEFVIGQLMRESARGTDGRWAKNLGSQFKRIIRKAGISPWRSPFQSLRVTRQNELVKLGIPLHVACALIGNTEEVARSNYLQVDESDYLDALKKIVGGQIEGSKSLQSLPVQNALCKESLSVFSKNAFLAMVSVFRVCLDRVT
jgi:integrase